METPFPRLWWTADRSELVEDGDVRAAFLAHAGWEPVPDAHLELLEGTDPKPDPKPAPVKRATRKRA